MIEKMVKIGILFDIYGPLLTEKQQDIMDMYYYDDLSLGEISEQLGITRQGVYDAIKKSSKLLLEYEEKLKFSDRFEKNKICVNGVLEKLEHIKQHKEKQSVLENLIDELENELKKMIEE